jgi:BMFP domain-containing protein YqiC
MVGDVSSSGAALARARVRELEARHRSLRLRLARLRSDVRHPAPGVRWGTLDRRRSEIAAIEQELGELEARYRWLG